jgi:hypothetical protein
MGTVRPSDATRAIANTITSVRIDIWTQSPIVEPTTRSTD